jgi:hypothetical protein
MQQQQYYNWIPFSDSALKMQQLSSPLNEEIDGQCNPRSFT